MNRIDLRSDTVTWPTPEMRRAMAEAPVGDDVYGEDPTVNALEEQAAARLGKEAGLFVVSGTMGNVTSVLTHCGRGDEIIVGDKAHIYNYEGGNPATHGGVHSFVIKVQPDGTLPLAEIEEGIRPDDPHDPRTRLICLENTQGAAGGVPLPLDYLRSVGALAQKYGLKVHIDGARLFNAAAATGCDARELVEVADSVSICLSKGLCAPVGSVIVGSREFIRQARRVRKSLGGGMRQAGILAAAGLIALNEMPRRLQEDHDNARLLAAALSRLPGISIDLARVQTNMVFINLTHECPYTPPQLIEKLKAQNVLIGQTKAHQMRAVTHRWISRADIEQAIDAFTKAVQ